MALIASPAIRIPFLMCHLMSASIAFRGIGDITSSPDHASVLGLFLLIWMSHTVCMICLEQHTLGQETAERNWKAAYKKLFNARRIGLNNEAPLPEGYNTAIDNRNLIFSSRKTPTTWPCMTGKYLNSESSRRRKFFLARFFSALAIYGINYFYTQCFHMLQLLQYSDFLPSKEIYIRRIHVVTVRETLVRSWLVFHFVWSAWATFTGLHNVISLMAVSVGLDEPGDWPPLYGSIYEIYTIRRFWGKFWHRLVYRTNAAFGALVSQKVLRLPRASLLDRTLINFSVFLLSGIVHALVTWQLGFVCGYWQDIWWFCVNFIAMLAEEWAQWFARRLMGGRFENTNAGKAVGFLWVYGFLFWSLPKSSYPKISCGTG